MKLRSPHGNQQAIGQGANQNVSDPTRDKLIEAAGRVFAEQGYRAATVREICQQAGANIAAVNYHFRDKLGLYTEVLRQSVCAAHMDRARAVLDQNTSPQEKLRALIRVRMQSLRGADLPDWHFRIVAHELAAPTPALPLVIDEALLPIHSRMLEIVGSILKLPSGDEKTRLCVYSVIGQMVLYALAQPVLGRLWPGLKMTPAQLDRIADHIANFSLAYLHEAGARSEKPNRKQAKARK